MAAGWVGPNRRSFQKLASARLDDAKALLKSKRYDGAYYMAGYVIECALKACIAKRTQRHDFPPRNASAFYIHDLDRLVGVAGIEESFQRERTADPTLDRNWEIVKEWEPNSRYQFQGSDGVKAAKDLIAAIEDRHHGVLQCLSKYW